jgi:hypothetical protein
MTTERLALRATQMWVLALFLLPTDMVLTPLGGQAHVANLIGISMGLTWMVAVALARHEPFRTVHLAAALAWLATLAAWVSLALRGGDDSTWAGAERWMMVLLAFSGVALVVADGVKRLEDLHRVAATAVFAAAAASAVGVVQWRTSLDPSAWLRRLPGLGVAGDGIDTVTERGGVARVTGTALHPIEFGVGAALMLPVAIHLLQHDLRRSFIRRFVPLGLCGAAIPLSVSRSAVLVGAIAVGVMVFLMPPLPRLTALAITPVISGVVFLAVPGTASTLRTSFLRAGDDSSIQARLDDLGLVGESLAQHRWWGSGGGTYLPTDLFEILDNQYLLTIVEFGAIGGALFAVATLGVPLLLAAACRRRSRTTEMRSLAAALIATSWAGALAWATFDAWAFARFVGVSALMLGFLGVAHRLVEPNYLTSSDWPQPRPPEPQPKESSPWIS